MKSNTRTSGPAALPNIRAELTREQETQLTHQAPLTDARARQIDERITRLEQHAIRAPQCPSCFQTNTVQRIEAARDNPTSLVDVWVCSACPCRFGTAPQ